MVNSLNSFASLDGTNLVWHELGEGRPVVLIHGLFSSAEINWIKYGHAARIAGRGFRVIMPDLRAHGQSDAPQDPARYPPDVLADDCMALLAHLGLTDFDLGGYSLGARTAVRMMASGAIPNRLVIAGMGLQGLTDTRNRVDYFRRILQGLGTFEHGSPEWLAEAFLKTTKANPQALLPLLGSFVDTSEVTLGRIAQETLVLSGDQDNDNGSAEELARAMTNARYEAVPGNHMSAIVQPAFGAAIADFLAA